jgi:hypothetical protein
MFAYIKDRAVGAQKSCKLIAHDAQLTDKSYNDRSVIYWRSIKRIVKRSLYVVALNIDARGRLFVSQRSFEQSSGGSR